MQQTKRLRRTLVDLGTIALQEGIVWLRKQRGELTWASHDGKVRTFAELETTHLANVVRVLEGQPEQDDLLEAARAELATRPGGDRDRGRKQYPRTGGVR